MTTNIRNFWLVTKDEQDEIKDRVLHGSTGAEWLGLYEGETSVTEYGGDGTSVTLHNDGSITIENENGIPAKMVKDILDRSR